MKVFLSHAMSGLDESKVMKIRNDAIQKLTDRYGEIEVIDNYHHENVPENAGRLWHLGTSIKQLEEADAIYFCDNSYNSNGCVVETVIAILYHIRILNREFENFNKDAIELDNKQKLQYIHSLVYNEDLINYLESQDLSIFK